MKNGERRLTNEVAHNQRQSMMTKNYWMTKKDLALYIGKSTKTVERWVEKGALPPPKKVPGMRNQYWLKTVVDDWRKGDYPEKMKRLQKYGTV